MPVLAPPRLEHLRRLTDIRGLIKSARGDCPDRYAGYDAIDNADALRLCAQASNGIEADTFSRLAKTYFDCLHRGRRTDGGVHHHCEAGGTWHDDADEQLVQSRLARALAAVIVSELPIRMRLAAADWWRELLPHADHARTPRSAGNWLIALGHLREADPGRDLGRVRELARWLIEDGHEAARSEQWDWFESRFEPTSACAAAGLWHAWEMLGDQRLADVAEVATRFLVDQLFEDGLFLPVGTQGGWRRGGSKALFDQTPAEACSVVEALCTAQRIGGLMGCGQYADYAARWFVGNNVKGEGLLDEETGGCRDVLTGDGVSADQGASAMVACLLTHAALADRPVLVEEPTVYAPSAL